jgi:MFS superfamily sulfate permease-like transporter
VVVPKAMAYATIAGLRVEIGIYTVLVPMAVYALFGTSRPLGVSLLFLAQPAYSPPVYAFARKPALKSIVARRRRTPLTRLGAAF